MSHFIALEQHDRHLLVAAARTTGRRYQIQSAFSIDLPADEDDAQVAQRLRTALTDHGLGRSDAIAVVSRRSIEMRELLIPPAPDNELPDMVRFQARNEFASFNEQWSIDFVPFASNAIEPRRVLASAMSPQLSEQIIGIGEKAGLRVKSIVLRPYAVMDLLKDKLADNTYRLIIDTTSDEVDLTIVAGPQLVATRTVRLPEDYQTDQIAAQIVNEIKLTLASTKQRLSGRNIEQVLVCGTADDNKLLKEKLTHEMNLDVHFVQPFLNVQSTSSLINKMPEHPERYASLLGALVQQLSGDAHQIDFLNPRRPEVKKEGRQRTLLYAGAAAAVMLLGLLLGWWLLSSQSNQIAVLNEELNRVKLHNEGKDNRAGVDQIIGEVDLIDQWKSGDINWLDELSAISESCLTPDDVMLDSLEAKVRSGRKPQIIVHGRIADIDIGTELKKKLAEQRYEIVPGRIGNSVDDMTYPNTFEQRLDLNRNFAEMIQQIDAAANKYLGNSDGSK